MIKANCSWTQIPNVTDQNHLITNIATERERKYHLIIFNALFYAGTAIFDGPSCLN